MKLRRGFVGWIMAVAVGWSFGLPAAPSPGKKSIKLRHGTIVTPAKRPAEAGLVPPANGRPGSAVSGLHLLQFEDSLKPEWREELAEMGVRLVSYVPDDAFVARLTQSSLEAIRALSYVRWIEAYSPAQKVDSSVRLRMALGNRGALLPRAPLPVSVMLDPQSLPADVQQIKGAFAGLRQEAHNRFYHILRGTIPVERLDVLSRSSAVVWIEPLGEMKLFDEVATDIVAGDAGPGVTTMQTLGYDGSGVTVAVADSGLHLGNAETMHPDLFGRVDAFFQYGGLTDASDEHSHGTHVTGIVAGSAATGETDENGDLYGLGVAPGVHIVAQRIFDGDGDFKSPLTFEELTRDAVQAGADIGSNSWGEDKQGRYDSYAAEFDALVRDADAETPGDQPYILEFSAGNAGPGAQSIGTPAVAKNVIATGASQNDRFDQLIYAEGQDAMADFSSRGPAEDGRIKPDLVAPGTWIASLQSAAAGAVNAWLPISENYQYQGGTSQAGPQVSGAAAIFVEYYRAIQGGATPSPAMVKAALIHSAVDMEDSDGTAPVPNHDEGWGRVDLTELIGTSREFEFFDQTEPLVAAQVYEHQVEIDSNEQPFLVTLVYTDVPGFPATIPALVNNLDLEVIGPDGTLYLGNQFHDGESFPGGVLGDALNNVEAVRFLAPQPGVYQIRVRARNVVQDARVDTPLVDQDFALVVSGSFLDPGAALAFFDRAFYRSPDLARVSVLDFDQAGAGSLTVSLQSDSEASSETLVLQESFIGGLFTNSMEIVAGSPLADGRLQVAHGDLLQIQYEDQSTGLIATGEAEADLVAPVLSNVRIVESFGRVLVRWEADEPVNGTVYFDADTVLDRTASKRSFSLDQEVELANLVSGQTYYYQIVSEDRAGNVTTNDNGGALFSFVAPFAPDVLIVDAFFGDFLFTDPPPIENYTDPLEELGVSYDVWEILSEGSPTLEDLRPFKVVMWRLPVFSLTRPTFTPAEQTVIREYLQAGGSFFLADMDVLTRLEETGATSFMREVLHVDSFETDVTVDFIEGVADDPITDGMVMELDYLTDYFGFNISDNITPTGDAVGILLDSYNGGMAGLRYPRPGISSSSRVVYLAFPLGTIPPTGTAPNNRTAFMLNVLKFLAPGLNGEAVLSMDRNAYTIPSQATIEVADSDLTGAGQVMVAVTNSTSGVGFVWPLDETTRAGIFRGTVTLVSQTSGLLPGQLSVQENDVLEVVFFDDSQLLTVRASARVETVPPLIDNISYQANYIDATVRWDTSELADALVQYSESSSFLNNRTAFDPALDTSHEVRVTGLLPDRTYYFRVLSRDEAGNAKLEDNGGNAYSFRTLPPLVPPWADDLETGTTEWVVITDDYSESSWTLGTPANGVENEAHSPVNAWGSNLDGGVMGVSGTLLISPAIDLSRASTATLRFWHSMKFSNLSLDIDETAALLAITNSLSDFVILNNLSDDTGGWEELTVDLTPFAGRVVFLVWNYALFSLDYGRRPGWLIDDITLEVTEISGGTILITNNLGQSLWTLTGPLMQEGGGWQSEVTQAPPGDYTVTFGDVPFYLTPNPQSGSLEINGTLLLAGDYSYPDINSNQISDLWEEDQLGQVDPSHPSTVDTDADGFVDGDEFIAGTDPNDPASKLSMARPVIEASGDVQLIWDSVAGRLYRVEGTGDGHSWAPVSPWIQATGETTSFDLPAPSAGAPFLFRVEVRP